MNPRDTAKSNANRLLPQWVVPNEQNIQMTSRTPLRQCARLEPPTLGEIRDGVPVGFLDDLKETLEITETQLAAAVGIARRTLVRRRKGQEVLRLGEADRATMLAKVFNMALSYFDDNREHAIEWLKFPNPALGGETPLERADTAIGKEDVVDLIGRMEHGIPT